MNFIAAFEEVISVLQAWPEDQGLLTMPQSIVHTAKWRGL